MQSAQPDQADGFEFAGLDRRGWTLLGLAAAVLTAGAIWFGVWEPWEAEMARVLDDMSAQGAWRQVIRGAGEQLTVLPELPYGWWPLRASAAVFGTSELGLRLPGLLMALASLWAVCAVTRRLYGDRAALLAGAATLTMPLFTFHGSHVLGLGVGAGLMTLGALALIRAAADEDGAKGWLWLGWLATAGSALCTGIPGLAPPALAGLAAAWEARKQGAFGPTLRRLLAPLPVALAVILIGAGWAAALTAEGAPRWTSLLLWADPLTGGSGSPSFEQFVHQIGFGLFPLGALLPFAFGSLLWAPAPADEPAGARRADPGVAMWFAAAFLGPALAMPATGGGLFPGAPAVAIAVGVYLARSLRSGPAPILVLGSVMILYLLDSNLSHNTHYLADTLVGGEVSDFPDKLSGWSVARLLTLCLMLVLALYQADLKGRVRQLLVKIAYPRRLDGALLGILIVIAVILTYVIMSALPGPFDRLIDANNATWRRLVRGMRSLIVFTGLCLPVFGVVYGVVWARLRQLNGQTEGKITALVDRLHRLISRPGAGFVAMMMVLAAWGVFLNLPVARALTRNFSEKHLLSVYEDLAQAGEPLYRHRLTTEDKLFYARDLETLSVADFSEKAKGDRFFALIPRKRLSDVHSALRAATGEILPVLDDTSSRYLLVSNRLGEREVDHNPIRSALVEAIPADAHKVSVNFENKVELIGWRLVPATPRRGSPLDIELYWKVLDRIPGDYKVFVHIDAAGSRIHGDHDPVEGLYPTSKWGQGEIIRDVHKVTVKKSNATGRHTFYAGLFRGSRRMEIREGPKDKDNRARLGTVSVR